jgi:glycerophosphoryl diester phosphodiesterase
VSRKNILGLIVFLIATVSLSQTPSRKPIPTVTPNLKIMRSAHRGVREYAPENTLPAIKKAIDMGYDYVEMDVRYTKEGVPVLLHDGSVIRTTNGFKGVSSYTLAELKKLDAGSRKGNEFKGTQVPTIEEALSLMQGRIKLYLDQKEPARPELVRLLKQHGFYPDNLVVCHGLNSIPSFLKYEPGAPVMPYLGNASQVEGIIKQFPTTVAFDTNCAKLTPEMVLEAHKRGVMVFTDALAGSSAECMARPIKYGADVIQFDNVELFSTVLEQARKDAGATGKK